jgi:Flavin containing amine oxidoreductase
MKRDMFVYLASLLGCLLLLVDTAVSSCPNVVQDFDVIVVGAGMAGISAAARLIEDEIANRTVVVLESTNRIGGRIKSMKGFGKGGPDGSNTDGWTIEQGAAVQISYPGNEVFGLLQGYDMKYTHTDFLDYKKSTYQYHDYLPVSPPASLWQSYMPREF